MTVWEGRRWSAANAYLRPALKHPNVRLKTGVRAERVLFDGRRAVGVAVRRRGREETVHARKEVILSASAFNSPQLLMLSGIGPAEHLREHGIEVVANRPGVGANLQDHLEVYVQQTCLQADHAQRASGIPGAPEDRAAMARLAQTASAPPTISRPAPSSARAPESAIPTCSFTSCRPRCAMTAAPPPRRTASRCISGRCAPPSRGTVRLKSSDPAPGAFDPLQLHVDGRGLARLPHRHPADARNLRAAGADAIQRRGDRAGRRGAVGRGARRFRAGERGERLPSLRHLPHGRARRRDGGGRPRMPGDRHTGSARGGFLRLPEPHQRQSQRPVDHGRREGRRHDPGPPAAARLQPGAVDATRHWETAQR